VDQAAKYLAQADECRRLAKLARGEQRTLLLEMAQTWATLAKDRTERLGLPSEKPADGKNGVRSE
jgi:hypothetical protein